MQANGGLDRARLVMNRLPTLMRDHHRRNAYGRVVIRGEG
jgi:hypothetical protein